MSLIVQKYGGRAVADIDRIKKIAEQIVRTKKNRNDVVVVVSAMAGETNHLDGLARKISDEPCLADYDLLLATGEQVVCALLSMAIQRLGEKAKPLLAHQIPITTDEVHTDAFIEKIDKGNLERLLGEGIIPVVAGFQGVSDEGEITTFGRGGSDITAVALAATLQATKCQLYKDVKGVFTADPSVVSDARIIPLLSYDEMFELSSMGAFVIHSRAVHLAKKYKVMLEVKSTLEEGEGTVIDGEKSGLEARRIVAITYDKNEAKISICNIPNEPALEHRIFSTLAENKIHVDMIVLSLSKRGLTDITFNVKRENRLDTVKILKNLTSDIEKVEIYSNPKVVKVSVLGDAMRIHRGTAARIFGTLAREGIKILTITTSETKISLTIDEKYAELALRSLHSEFGLDKKRALAK